MEDLIEKSRELPILKEEPIELFARYMTEQVKDFNPNNLCVKGLATQIQVADSTIEGLKMIQAVSKGRYSVVNSTFKTLEEKVTGSQGKYYNKTQMDLQIAAFMEIAYFLWVCRMYMGKGNGIKVPVEPEHMATVPVIRDTHLMRQKAETKFEAMCQSIEHHGCLATEFDMKQRMKQAWLKPSSSSSSQTRPAREPRQAIVITEE